MRGQKKFEAQKHAYYMAAWFAKQQTCNVLKVEAVVAKTPTVVIWCHLTPKQAEAVLDKIDKILVEAKKSG